jgi:uncharacterized membrane protein YdjX (TVP38/TMEM64 family)
VENSLLGLFKDYPQLAILLSIFISILIAMIGLLPSVFITAANILFFGFWEGTLISFLGEAIGAGVAFLLYRKGFKKSVEKKMDKYPRAKKLVNSRGTEAFWLILFVPSGLVTFAAAVGKPSFSTFIMASSLGKIPALLLEAYSVNAVAEFGWQGKLILAVVAVGLLYWILSRRTNMK